jgi:cytoskeletal protein RodZ
MSTGRKILLYVLYFVAVVALGVIVILAFTHHGATKPPIKHPGDSKTQAEKPTATPTQSSPKSPATSDSSTDGTDQVGAAARDAVNKAKTDAQLANTGPGSTAAIFVGASIAGAVVYRRRQLTRYN